MLNALAVAGVVASLFATTSGPVTTAAEPPGGGSVELVTVNGSGCPAAEGTAAMSADGTLFTITSPAYFAWAGGAARPTDLRKNCQVSVRVARPSGWTFAVSQLSSTGFAYLTAGATGTTRVTTYFQGGASAARTHVFSGPKAEPWATTDTTAEAALNYAPCGTERNLNINTEVRVGLGTSDPAASSFMIRESTTVVRLAWRACPSS